MQRRQEAAEKWLIKYTQAVKIHTCLFSDLTLKYLERTKYPDNFGYITVIKAFSSKYLKEKC